MTSVPAVAGAVALIVNVVLAPAAKLLLKVTVQVAVVPALKLVQLTVFPLPAVAVSVPFKPLGNASSTLIVAPLLAAELPVLLMVKV